MIFQIGFSFHGVSKKKKDRRVPPKTLFVNFVGRVGRFLDRRKDQVERIEF